MKPARAVWVSLGLPAVGCPPAVGEQARERGPVDVPDAGRGYQPVTAVARVNFTRTRARQHYGARGRGDGADQGLTAGSRRTRRTSWPTLGWLRQRSLNRSYLSVLFQLLEKHEGRGQ
jgi:hypothetical protein